MTFRFAVEIKVKDNQLMRELGRPDLGDMLSDGLWGALNLWALRVPWVLGIDVDHEPTTT
jgi:hypothetical protein